MARGPATTGQPDLRSRAAAHLADSQELRQGLRGSSYLEFSRDGTDFTQEAKGREVDGKIRDTLQWGLDRPGGKGKKKGFGESFLSTTLLAEQDAVTAVLNRGLDDDPDESGKQRLVDALQALAQDPAFRQVLAATQQKVDEAYTGTGRKKSGRGSPWVDLRTQRQAAEKRRAEVGAQASDSSGARRLVEELRDQLGEAQSRLDDGERIRAQIETAWQQQQARAAIQTEINAAIAKRDRIQALHDQLAEGRTALEAAGEAVKLATTKLQGSTRKQGDAAETLHAARERLSELESSKTEQARKIHRQEIDKSLLENQNRQSAVEQRRTEAASVSAIQDKTDELRAEVDGKSSTFAEAEALVDKAASQNQVDADEISGIEETLQAAQVLAARKDRDRARDSSREATELEAEAAAGREQAQKIRDDVAQLDLPDPQESNRSLSSRQTSGWQMGSSGWGFRSTYDPRDRSWRAFGPTTPPGQDACSPSQPRWTQPPSCS